MRGSEKQLAWAEEVSANVINTLEKAIQAMKNDPQYDPQNITHIQGVESCEMAIRAIQDCEYAGDIIECFGDIHFKNDLWEDYGDIRAVYRSRTPYTEGQRKLLMKEKGE
jgi:hypothetical protein